MAGIELTDASVLVVGASGGLGGALARSLRDRGARLTLVGRDEARLRSRAAPADAVVVTDLRDPAGADAAVAAALDRHGRLDVVVNAAGVVAFGPLEELDDDTLLELTTVNLLAPLRLLRAALPHLDGGVVVNLSAVVAEQPVAGMVAYSATKAALSAASTGLQRELRRRRISVIDVRPPHTETGLATRPIAGESPALPSGLDPAVVAERIVAAIESGERAVPSHAFA